MELFFGIAFDNELLEELNNEMDDTGKIILGNGDMHVQIMPVEEFRFMPGEEQIIQFILNVAGDVAIGLFINWLWDRLNRRKSRKIKIDGTDYNVQNEEDLENVLKSVIELKRNECEKD